MAKIESTTLIILCFFTLHLLYAGSEPVIFPAPKQLETADGALEIDENTEILLPEPAVESDWFLARLLAAELSDHQVIRLF